jgi:hypothetical protein
MKYNINRLRCAPESGEVRSRSNRAGLREILCAPERIQRQLQPRLKSFLSAPALVGAARSNYAPKNQRKKPMKKPINNENKMLTLNVRFWTDGIAPRKGDVIPKHTLDFGVVSCPVGANSLHKLEAVNPIPFHGMYDLERAIRKTLRAHKIVQHI